VVLKRDFFPNLAVEHGVSKEFAEQCKVGRNTVRLSLVLPGVKFL
jgi:hypothetical protein